MSHAHLTIEDRVCIAEMLEKGMSQSKIAKHLEVPRSKISRELKRNGYPEKSYNPAKAQRAYQKRRKKCKITPKLIAEPEQLEAVKARLEEDWSPEQIVHVAEEVQVSTSTIYRAIHKRIIPRSYTAHFRRLRFKRGWKKGKKRTKQQENLPSIHDRPRQVVYREEFGHWEGDTVAMKRGNDWCLLTLVERVSRFPITIALPNKEAASATEGIVRALRSLPPEMRKTVTFDRGSEFYGWKFVQEALPGTKVYFADPHAPWQRGSNENTNGLYRQYYPKKTDIPIPSQDELNSVNARIVNRPRKCLNWSSPAQIFLSALLHLT